MDSSGYISCCFSLNFDLLHKMDKMGCRKLKELSPSGMVARDQGCSLLKKIHPLKFNLHKCPTMEKKGTTMHSSNIDKENIRPKEFIKVPTQVKQNFEAEACNSSFQTHCTIPSFKLQHKLLLDQNKTHGTNELNRKDGQHNLLSKYEKKSPPRGEKCIILYTTTIRGVRKTFDDCNKIRFLLRSLRVSFLEMDVSMHLNFRDDLWSIMGGRSIPPRLFIKGRYIGGAEEVVGLHDEGKLKQLLEGIAVDSAGGKCEECGEMRFLICRDCHGCGKLDAGEDSFTRCQSCNENGLVVCSLCTSLTS